jgi:hypothetical protein
VTEALVLRGHDRDRAGRRRGVYLSSSGRFRVRWIDRQGARSGWTVSDHDASRQYRCDSLRDAVETIGEILGEPIKIRRKP